MCRGSIPRAVRLVVSPEIDAPAGSSATPVTAWRKAWKVDGPHFLGHNISHVQLDPRDGRTLLAAAKTGDIGFPMVVHPRDADTAWVFPMDGTTVWPRTSPEGRPAAYVTRNAGRTWQRLDEGLPNGQAWWTAKRQAMTVDAQALPALYLGTTSGELWIGHEEGARWSNIARHLPEIYAVEVVQPA